MTYLDALWGVVQFMTSPMMVLLYSIVAVAILSYAADWAYREGRDGLKVVMRVLLVASVLHLVILFLWYCIIGIHPLVWAPFIAV